MTPCISQHIRESQNYVLCLKDDTNKILQEYHANLEHDDEKTQITKRALKFICNYTAMINLDLLSYPT